MQHNETLIHAVLCVLTIIHATECLQSVASQGATPIFPKLEHCCLWKIQVVVRFPNENNICLDTAIYIMCVCI